MLEHGTTRAVMMVEGKDEVNFFDAMLRHLQIGDCEIQDVGGKDQFSVKAPALLRRSGLRDLLAAVAVVRDADADANGAFRSARDILRKEGLAVPERMGEYSSGKPRVGIYIMPGSGETGMLEDLCLRSVEAHPAMLCVHGFMDCVQGAGLMIGNPAKARAQAFLSAMPEIVQSVGVAAQRGYWSFASDEFSELRQFVRGLFIAESQ